VNELAETGDVASAMALAAANMFVNAETEGFAEGTYCFDNPEDEDCLGGGPDPDFLAQAFAGNHFVEDMVNDMGFAYTFTENDLKPNYCEESPWLEMNLKRVDLFARLIQNHVRIMKILGMYFSTMMIIQLFAKRIQMTQCVLEETL
jgi:hypothetical protein